MARRIAAVLLAHLVVTVSPQETSTCAVCGEGLEVGNPNGIFTFPGQPAVQCGLLEETGTSGQITTDQCFFLPDLIADSCGCQASAPSTGEVTAAPFSPALFTPSPVPDAPILVAPAMATPTVTPPGCSVCGEGSVVTIPDAVFSFPSQPSTPCGVLQDAGKAGQIPLDQCPFLPAVIGSLCGCAPASPGEPPIASPVSISSAPITFAPVDSPRSPVPSTSPTTATALETESPTSVPSKSVSTQGPTLINTPFPTYLPTSVSSEMETTLEPSLSTSVEPTDSQDTPVAAPFFTSMAPITFAPVGDPSVGSPVFMPSMLSPPCSICGDDKQVGNLDAVISLPGGDPPIACEVLEEAGEDGFLQPSECNLLAGLVNIICGCVPLPPISAMPAAPNAPVSAPNYNSVDNESDDEGGDDENNDSNDSEGAKGKKGGKGGKKGKGNGKKAGNSNKKSAAGKTGGKKGAGKNGGIFYSAPLPPRNDWPVYSPVYAAGRHRGIGKEAQLK